MSLIHVTDNISSRAILLHNNIFNRYLPALLYLLCTTLFYVSVSKGAASTIFYTFGMLRPRDWNSRPPALKADALPTELPRPLNIAYHRNQLFISKPAYKIKLLGQKHNFFVPYDSGPDKDLDQWVLKTISPPPFQLKEYFTPYLKISNCRDLALEASVLLQSLVKRHIVFA